VAVNSINIEKIVRTRATEQERHEMARGSLRDGVERIAKQRPVIYTGHIMRTINASTFKAQCLALLDEVKATGQRIQIVKHGKPVAEVVPPTRSPHEFPQRQMSKKGRVKGDLVKPMVSENLWEADDVNLK
jgi:prevent-host-death family protein